MCCSPWGRKEVETTWQLNNNKNAGGWGVQSPIFQFNVIQTPGVSISSLLKANKDTYLFWTDKLSSAIEVVLTLLITECRLRNRDPSCITK